MCAQERRRCAVRRKPPWLKTGHPGAGEYKKIKGVLRELSLHTVCQEARCPNLGECWGSGTATFMILGDTCTRACRFCAVKTGDPGGLVDEGEPARLLEAALAWRLGYVVITSVDRDDLQDGGAGHFAAAITALREGAPEVGVEVLVPDFGARTRDIGMVTGARPDVYAHNVETVERLQPRVRDRRASYRASLEALRLARRDGPQEMITKSSVMVGLGETDGELLTTLGDLRGAGVEAVTIGQYLPPSARSVEVARYPSPDIFDAWRVEALSMGFTFVASGPLVRSSYRAHEVLSGRGSVAPAPSNSD